MKYLTNIDLTKQQLVNAAIHNLASAPANPVEGQVYQNTVDHKLYVYNGSEWVDLAASGNMAGSEIITAINGAVGTIDLDNLNLTGLQIDWADVTNGPTGSVVNIDAAASNVHVQNTDTGTTAASFTVGSGGVKIRTNSGELQVRNNANDDYADIRVKNLTVEGTTTTINSTTVEIDDNQLVLNAGVAASGQNSDGGILIKRYNVNGDPINAELHFSETDGLWYVEDGVATSTSVGSYLARKGVFVVGDNSNTTLVVNHYMNSQDLAVSIRQTNSPYEQVYADVEFTSLNSLTVKFATAPTTNQYTVTIVG